MTKSNTIKIWLLAAFTALALVTNEMHDEITVYQQMIIECEKPVKVERCKLVALAE